MYYLCVIRSGNYKLIWNIAHQIPFAFALDLVQSNTWRSAKDLLYYGKRKKNDLINNRAFELYELEKDPDEINNLCKFKDAPKYFRRAEKQTKSLSTKD